MYMYMYVYVYVYVYCIKTYTCVPQVGHQTIAKLVWSSKIMASLVMFYGKYVYMYIYICVCIDTSLSLYGFAFQQEKIGGLPRISIHVCFR